MKYGLFVLFMLTAGQVASAGPQFVGMWFTCNPEHRHAHQYTLLTVEPVGKHFRVASETGQIFSFSGSGRLVSGDLHVRGCHFSRDDPGDCDPEKPPPAFIMKPAEFNPHRSPSLAAMRASKPVYTSAKRWEALAKLCQQAAAEFQRRQ
jgi:hypothetical protein